MKMKLLGLAAVAAMIAAAPATSQTPPATPQPAPAAPAPTGAPAAAAKSVVPIPRGVFLREQLPSEWLVRDRLIGKGVRNKDGVVIGDIEDVILNRDGTVVGVIMGVGGLLGVGEKKIGVRITALQITEQDGRTVVTLPAATKEILGALEAYKRAQPKAGVVSKTKDAMKNVGDRTKATVKDAYGRAKDAVAPAPTGAPAPAAPAPAPATPAPTAPKQ